MKKWYEQTDIMLALAVISVIVMLIIPIPTFLLDLLIGINMMLGLIILLTAMYSQESSDFMVFPSLLLLTTVYRLALNVSSTRLILLEGSNFDSKMIRSFGEFVVSGNYIIGLIIFLILILVQMMVITKGATRISEVAARFTLDALPGKQMSIDSDLSAGIITEEDARERRNKLRKEVDFYGQMDGATKFVQGDVRVGLIITVINIIGGLIIGVFTKNEGFIDTLKVYTLLTIGDGLVAQLPSLLITTATGMVVTRASSTTDIGTDISEQLFHNPTILWIVAGTLAMASIVPGFPKLPLWFLASFCGLIAYVIQKNANKQFIEQAEMEEQQKTVAKTERFLDDIGIDPIKLEVGYNLITLVDDSQSGNLLEKITLLRQKFAKELGMIIPPIRINDNMELEGNAYSILIGGIEVETASVYPDKLIAMEKGSPIQDPIDGEKYTDPTFRVDAILIQPENKIEAENRGYLVVDSYDIIITHLSETLKNYAPQIMGREEVKMLIDKIKEKNPFLIEEINKNTSLKTIQQVLHNLLKEQISVRNLVLILETIADYAEKVTDSAILTEFVRQRIRLQIIKKYVVNNTIEAIQIDPAIENEMRKTMHIDEKEGKIFALHPNMQTNIKNALFETYNKYQKEYNRIPIFICTAVIRFGILHILERELPLRDFVVLAYEEIPNDIQIQSKDYVSLPALEEVNT